MNLLKLHFFSIKLSKLFLLAFLVISLASCDDDGEGMVDPGPMLTGNESSFTLFSFSNSDISGSIVFKETDNNSTIIVITLSGTPTGGAHPAHIHFNTAVEGGGIAVSLNPVNGSTGLSSTEITQQDDGTAISYNQFIDFDGYVNIHLSEADLATIVAQGDIGQNVLTSESKTFTLEERAVEGINGTATFTRRANDETLVTLQLQNTPEGGVHPAHIHDNTAVEGGGIAISLTSVDGSTGMSMINISQKDDGTAITYSELIDYNGYINVHLSAEDLGTIVAQGDIGSNELTGQSETFALEERAVAGISGTATFEERKNGSALITIALQNTPEGGVHPAHIHFNTAAEGGDIAITLTSVNGTTGISNTSVSQLDNETEISYLGLLGFDGYINVHLSLEDLSTIVAQGDIGANAQ